MGKRDRWLKLCLCGIPCLMSASNVLCRCFDIFFKSFFANYVLAEGGMTHTLVEPVFWIIDSVLISIGPFLTVLVTFLSSYTVFAAYWIAYPYFEQRNKWLAYFLSAVGNWILLNFVFNYYMGFSVTPGHPPKHGVHGENVGLCRKCLTPKPPRTHHCSICNQCVLKMDHHCPWMNHCVGHWNHRYFYLFMVYALLGSVFLLLLGYQPGRSILINNHESYDLYYENLNDVLIAIPEQENFNRNQVVYYRPSSLRVLPLSSYLETHQFRYKTVIFLGLILAMVATALLVLTVWHGRLISRGETSIEFLTNQYETAKRKKDGGKFQNRFDFGWKRNWRLFLGLYGGRSWWIVLLPSAHKPLDDGITWTAREEVETILSGKHDKQSLPHSF